jgi:Fe-S-cluster-containing dehydrogenase component
MTEEKQIEEMARTFCGGCDRCLHGNCRDWYNAEALYNAGYRKQSESEWIKKYEKAPRYVCSSCNHLYNNKTFKYCPNRGAKMKGG